MKILNLEVENFRSFRDRFYFDLTNNTLTGNLPPKGQTWNSVTYPVAGIFGANAAGKTAVIRALSYLQSAIISSAAGWLESSRMVRDPFKLEKRMEREKSTFAIDFVLISKKTSNTGGTRYHYEFIIDTEGVQFELLQAYYSSRPSRLFQRDNYESVKFKTGIRTIDVSPRELVLSRAFYTDHPVLGSIAKELTEGMNIYKSDIEHRDLTLKSVANGIYEGVFAPQNILQLTQAADIGIIDIGVTFKKSDFPEAIIQHIINEELEKEIKQNQHPHDSHVEREHRIRENLENAIKVANSELVFTHLSKDSNNTTGLNIDDESDGTLVWLAIASHAVRALRNGTILCVDELDTSLHPTLAAELVRLFQDPNSNPHGGQLIFTSHDISLLTPQMDLELENGQIWLVEKDNTGASTLYSLGDFSDLRKDSNISKQYLEGRLGGVPRLAPALIAEMIARV